MRIALLGSSLEPGRDGVGDYSLCLAAELRRQGHDCLCIGLQDTAATGADGLLRLSAAEPWGPRHDHAAAALRTFAPDWVSLQFVAYAWHPRGWAFAAARRLAPLVAGFPLHVMLHELWVGISRNDRFANRLHGVLQRRAILGLLRRTRPAVLHTQTPAYVALLAAEGVEAGLLTLFGNLPVVADDGTALPGLLTRAGRGDLAAAPRKSLLVAGWFGTVHPEWDGVDAAGRIAAAARAAGRKAVFLDLGRTGPGGAALVAALAKRDGPDHCTVATGGLEPAAASRLIGSLDVALTSNPVALVPKSGTVAAFMDHGIPVLASRDDWRPRGSLAMAPLDDPLLRLSPTGVAIDLPALLALRRPPARRLPAIAVRFVAALGRRGTVDRRR